MDTRSATGIALLICQMGVLGGLASCETGTTYSQPWTEAELREDLEGKASRWMAFEAELEQSVPCEFTAPPPEGYFLWRELEGMRVRVGRTGNSPWLETGQSITILTSPIVTHGLSEQPFVLFAAETVSSGSEAPVTCAEGAPLSFMGAYGMFPGKAPDRWGLMSHEEAYELAESWKGRMTPESQPIEWLWAIDEDPALEEDPPSN